MTLTDRDVEDLLAEMDRGQKAWFEGELDAAQDNDMTIFGPFGGEAGRGPGLPERQLAVAQLFESGSGQSEVVKTIVAGDVVVVVSIERNDVVLHGLEGTQPWTLRTTQVFERRDGGWVRLHRHADPLIDRRSAADTFAIARGERA